jgi:hypothetical protein
VGTKLDKTIVNLLKGGLEDQIMTSLKAWYDVEKALNKRYKIMSSYVQKRYYEKLRTS